MTLLGYVSVALLVSFALAVVAGKLVRCARPRDRRSR